MLPASINYIRAVTAAFIQMSISCMMTFFESMCISKISSRGIMASEVVFVLLV